MLSKSVVIIQYKIINDYTMLESNSIVDDQVLVYYEL
ncbi:hypothetical protein CLSAP_04980 [Clostridium saccharoperbutylacetonicum]|uniref:Uncharacterized protein n=1 Tax=Clostridium saccharoperbutylacetonicum N1-4(HMT) TaxID=931276 RepID=M1MD37_9CLOT|nr:hypothetical protein Cspa_c04950 [Clostridium saccharoperbutylacetonicum N1-4(HMT)]AQR93208.1 hypothetical protein CLSAP_04980 [Clostridium saccharoperbutylacetonicum]